LNAVTKFCWMAILFSTTWLASAAEVSETEKPMVQADASVASAKGQSDGDYRIGPSNLLEIKVMQAPEMSRSLRVDTRGNISLPLIGVVHAAGLTSYELEQEIAARLAQDLIRNPDVSVFVRELTSQRIILQGLVRRPGVLDIQGRTTLLEAISMGGGLEDKADPSNVKVIRPKAASNSATTDKTLVFDLEAIRKSTSPDPVLDAGDTVVVEEAPPVTVEGAVLRPGIFYPRNRTTLMQLISQSGGLSEMADPSQIKIYSVDSKGEKVTTAYDLEKIRDGKQTDPVVRPGNIIVVEKSSGKAFVNGVGNFLRGLIGVRPIVF
jgi:polysaccharide export outer membrane protein